MKLKNKRTGEIGYTAVLRSKAIVVMDENAIQLGSYTSLAELNAEWEDAPEEPKPQVVYYIDRDGEIVPYRNIEYPKRIFNAEQNKEIGNYFDTREEAEKAVEKLKAWERLKDKGFRFLSNKTIGEYGSISYCLTYPATRREDEDLDLLFGGEE